MFPAWLPTSMKLCCNQISPQDCYPPPLLSSVGWNIICLLNRSCFLCPLLSWRCLLCSSSSMTHDFAFSSHCYYFLLLPRLQAASPPIFLQLACFVLKHAVSSLWVMWVTASQERSYRAGAEADRLHRIQWGAADLQSHSGTPVISPALQQGRERI